MMRAAWTIAARDASRAKGRSALMAIPLVVGVVAILLTVATSEGTRRAVEKSFRAMIGALDVLLVQPGGIAQRGMATMESAITTLTPADAEALAASVPNVRSVGGVQSAFSVPVEANGRTETTVLFAATANWASIRGDSVAKGTWFGEADNAALARVIVLGADLARALFPSGDAVGSHVRLRGIDFGVIGVLAPNGAGPGGASMDNLAYIPLATGQRRVFNRDHLSLVSVKLVNPGKWPETEGAVVALLRQRHGTRAGLDDFRVSSPQAMIARVAGIDTMLRRSLIGIGLLALAIGGIVIAAVMNSAASSRSGEIAVRRAVGATRGDVMRLFWAEAWLVSATAAVAGVVLGVAATGVGASAMRLPLAISWPITFGAAAVCLGIGALAGYYPARRASRLSPADVLRAAADA
ncbi:MAG TPA: ABC transporter permease [Gemmatimonadaceae bacterium]|nr:ABC transporter permease [Gemmatimonadaceae bacterium]